MTTAPKQNGKGRQGLTLASPIVSITMHGHRHPCLYREKNLPRPEPSLSSAESFNHVASYILAEREGGNEPSHIKKEVCEALSFSL
jgi:hypothetical protein